MSRYKIEVGYFSSCYCFCKTPGRLPTGYGRESNDCYFRGGTIYNDAASSLVWVENHVSLGSNKTAMVNSRFEKWLLDHTAAEFSHYYGGNGTFTNA